MDTTTNNIVYFDGVCGLCNSYIDFLLRIDKKHKLQFAPLQGTTAKNCLKLDSSVSFNTIIYQEGNQLYYKSTAFIKILNKVGGFGKLVIILQIVPKSIRDLFYTLIATNRYKWFGKKETCRIPTADERDRFLD